MGLASKEINFRITLFGTSSEMYQIGSYSEKSVTESQKNIKVDYTVICWPINVRIRAPAARLSTSKTVQIDIASNPINNATQSTKKSHENVRPRTLTSFTNLNTLPGN